MSKNSIRAIIGKLLPKVLIDFITSYTKGKSVEEVEIIYKVFKKKQSQNRVMLDVGAHFGTALLPFAKKGWTIHAFEPDPNNRAKLITNIKGLNNVSIETRAVSNTSDETVSFYTSDVSTGISSMSSFHESHKKTAEVKTVRLVDFCAEKSIQSVDFLKIDAEGFDLFVLKGFDWDSQSHPDYIITEFEDRKTIPLGYTFQEQANFLIDKGYKVIISEWHPIVEYGIRHHWKRFVLDPKKVTDELAWGNIIATKADKFDALVKVAKKVGHFE